MAQNCKLYFNINVDCLIEKRLVEEWSTRHAPGCRCFIFEKIFFKKMWLTTAVYGGLFRRRAWPRQTVGKAWFRSRWPSWRRPERHSPRSCARCSWTNSPVPPREPSPPKSGHRRSIHSQHILRTFPDGKQQNWTTITEQCNNLYDHKRAVLNNQSINHSNHQTKLERIQSINRSIDRSVGLVPICSSTFQIFSILEGSSRGDVMRFSTAKTHPSLVWIPMAVEPNCKS